MTYAKNGGKSAMDGSNNLDTLSACIKLGTDAGIDEAVCIASTMSINSICKALEELVAPDHEKLCHAFIEAWIPRLEPFERLAASVSVSHLYSLDLVVIDHAEDLSLLRVLIASSEATRALASELGDYRSIASSPDTSFNGKFANRLKDFASDSLEPSARLLDDYAQQLRDLLGRKGAQSSLS